MLIDIGETKVNGSWNQLDRPEQTSSLFSNEKCFVTKYLQPFICQFGQKISTSTVNNFTIFSTNKTLDNGHVSEIRNRTTKALQKDACILNSECINHIMPIPMERQEANRTKPV